MGFVVNCDPNPEGVDVSIDGELHHVELGGQLEVSDEKAAEMLTVPECWAAPAPDAPPVTTPAAAEGESE